MRNLARETLTGRPRIGFLGVGWIGRNRLEAIAASGDCEVAAVCDPVPEMAEAAREAAPGAVIVVDFEAMLASGLDAVVIATPSALHASQSIAALEAGMGVFCQKPVGRDAGEVADVLAAARRSDRLFLADFSYRHTAAARAMQAAVDGGQLGRIFAVDLAFHNAYGPDKPWFYDPALSGGGCVADLGVHLADLALWLLHFPAVMDVSSALFSGGQRLAAAPEVCEDYAEARITTADGTTIRLTCSWNLHAGQGAEIMARVYGSEGSVIMTNRGGSFYDFETRLCRGTGHELLSEPPDAWGGRAAADFARRLALDPGFDEEAEHYLDTAKVIDRIYGR